MRRSDIKIIHLLGSKIIFLVILVVFVINAAWIALSMGYAGQFDEAYHLGLINFYAKRWSPLVLHQPNGPAIYGAIARDPSYLYHYLMSFPDRFINLFTSDLHIQVVLLRLINVLIFGLAIVIFRKVLLKTKASSALINVTLLFFILIPVVPLLAAQINYDNLVMLMTAGLLLTTINFKEKLNHQQFNTPLLLYVLSIGMLGCLTQFLFLPIFVAVVVYLVYSIYKLQCQLGKQSLIKLTWNSFKSSGNWVKTMASIIFIVSLGLFLEMYGLNMVRYHTPVPACNQVITTQKCLNYYAFARNYQAEQTKTQFNANPIIFSTHWLYRLFEFSFYTVSGGSSPQANYLFKSPLLGISIAAILIFGFGILAVLLQAKRLMSDYVPLRFLLFVSMFFLASLWYRNYSDFLHTGQRVGINGRYLVPIILPIMLLIGLAYQQLLKNRLILKIVLLAVVFLFFMQGGGALTFINYSNSNWYWPNDRLVIVVNQDAQSIIRPWLIRTNIFHLKNNIN